MAIIVTVCACGGELELVQCKGYIDTYACKRCGEPVEQYDDTCGGR